MSKKPMKRSKSKPRAKAHSTPAHTAGTRTVKANGGIPDTHPESVAPERVPIGEAMRQAVEALCDVKIDHELAPQQLAELAGCYEEITRRQAAFHEKNEDAKTAKKSLESATELLLEKVRTFTHLAPLPLFDHVEAEADRQQMLAGGDDDSEDDSASEARP